MLWLAHFAENFIYHIWWHTNVFVSWSFDLEAVFRIRDNFRMDPDLRVRTTDFWIQIQILLSDPQNANQKYVFFSKFFCLLLLEGTFTSFFKDKKS